MILKKQKYLININSIIKITTIALFISCNSVNSDGNNYVVSTLLTHKQMQEDLDYFIKTVELNNPQLEVRKIVTGIDILAELKLLKLKIDTVNPSNFSFLINQAINTCQDGHTSTLWKSEYFQDDNFYKDLKDLALGKIDSIGPVQTENHNQIIDAFFAKYKFHLKLKYIDGEYYTVAPFNYANKTFNAGLKLIQCNEINIHELVANLFNDLNLRWDFIHNRFYNDQFYRAFSVLKKQNISLSFIDSNGILIKQQFNLKDSLKYNDYVPNETNEKKIIYFSEHKTLYLKVPCMCIEDTSFYGDTIKQIAKTSFINKIIIDIRNNGGGSDDVGFNILKAIIPDTIKTDVKLYANPTNQIIKYFKINPDNIKTIKPEFMDGKKYLDLYSATRTIDPDSNSINYKGKIYILQNENIFSAAGTFSAIAYYSENVINVGNATGRILGFGTDPVVFMLPNSKIMYRIEPLIDFSGAKSPMEVFHDHIEMPIQLTIKDYLNRIYNKGDLLSEKFLLNKDAAVKKIINLD